MINFKKITVDNNKFIYVFDDLFTENEKLSFFNYIVSSKFVFDGSVFDNKFKIKLNGKQFLQSFYSYEELLEMNFLQNIKNKNVTDLLNNFKINRSYVFCSDHTTQHPFHSDPGDYTMLYFPNLEWDNSYGGETMFASDQHNDIVYTTAYIPGRLIVFNSKIPHKMSAPSSLCPFHRFSFIINWSNNETCFRKDQ